MRGYAIAGIFLLSAPVLMTGQQQQCSDKAFNQTQDDISLSGPCNISVLSGDIITVKETKAYDLKCTTTDGNVSPGTVYFTDHISLVGNGARFCGTILSKPFSCDPVFSMTATLAQTPTDFNRFSFFEQDRSTGGNDCTGLGTQTINRQCTGKACDASKAGGGGGGGGGPDLPPCDPAPTVDGFQPVVDPFAPCMPSPIIIDTEGEGFHLTSADNGVMFDIRGNGHPIKLAWTAPGSHNAFLALDRDGSGTITSGKELFGNFTVQPKSVHPNGFLALDEYDKPENGGNGDGVIDDHDAVYSKLRLCGLMKTMTASPSRMSCIPCLSWACFR